MIDSINILSFGFPDYIKLLSARYIQDKVF